MKSAWKTKKLIWISIAVVILVGVLFGGKSFINSQKEFSVFDYRQITYREYQRRTGNDAEFLHYIVFGGDLPNTDVEIVFLGEYDEKTGERYLPKDSVAYRLQGNLCDLITLEKEVLSEEELLQALSKQYGKVLSIEYLEGVETIYYVSTEYAKILMDSDEDGEDDIIFHITVKEDENKKPLFLADDYARLIW